MDLLLFCFIPFFSFSDSRVEEVVQIFDSVRYRHWIYPKDWYLELRKALRSNRAIETVQAMDSDKIVRYHSCQRYPPVSMQKPPKAFLFAKGVYQREKKQNTGSDGSFANETTDG